jgi:hypothetical protein
MRPFILRFVAVFFFLTPLCLGQYYGERALERSFEQNEFFFTPAYINPFGMRGLQSVAPGVFQDPLLKLRLNPAYLYQDSVFTNYVYADFRNGREVAQEDVYGYPRPMLYGDYAKSSVSYMPYPQFYVTSRRELEPVFSFALLTKPLPSTLPDLSIGATYQLLMQDEKYYEIPQDIYRSSYGADYAGKAMTDSRNIPIVDKYTGTDDMHQKGHFGSFYVGYSLTPTLDIGARLGRAIFKRDGSSGSKNMYEYTSWGSSNSVWYNMESREQIYDHWDLGGGVNYRCANGTLLGVSGNYLWGNAEQNLTRSDTSNYSYIDQQSTNYWSTSRRYSSTIQHWDHKGKTYSLGLNLDAPMNESRIFHALYRYQNQKTDILLGSSIIDSSSYAYRYTYDTTYYGSDSRSLLSDVRQGSGTTTITSHRAMASLEWKMEHSMNLNIGILFESWSSETATDEPVNALYNSFYDSWSNSGRSQYLDAGSEIKNIEWTFNAKKTSIQIPIFFTWKITPVFEILAGLNKEFSTWETEEVTLAAFQSRIRTNLSGSTVETNFGERYTQPSESITDQKTTFLAGLTVSPSNEFSVRLLLSPMEKKELLGDNKTEYQWWIGVTLRP